MERHYTLIVNVVEMVAAVEPTVEGFFLISGTTGLNTKTMKNARAQVKAFLPKSAYHSTQLLNGFEAKHWVF